MDCDLCDRTDLSYRYEITGGQHTLHLCSDCYHDLRIDTGEDDR